ncbi:MAG: DegV family protein [Lachnospiraceae bacterium]|nr:DegV family protein [Lachnospiraceae bacterium]
MPRQYQIISDSSCDLPQELTRKHDIKVVPFYVSFDQENYYKEIVEMPVRKFYEDMVAKPGVFPKSSLPSIEDYIEAFTPFVKEQMPIICICITTKFSGSYNSATNARDILLEDYPDAKITVIDAQINTVLQGIYVLEAVRMRDAGLSYEETIETLERLKVTGRIIFTTADISYLKSGGRLGKLVSIANNALKIKPLIILKEGEIFPFGIARSRQKSLDKVIAQAKKYFSEIGESPDDYQIVVGFGYDYDEAVSFRDKLLESMQTYSNLETIDIFQIGATIGVHTGPHPLGLGLIKKYDCL